MSSIPTWMNFQSSFCPILNWGFEVTYIYVCKRSENYILLWLINFYSIVQLTQNPYSINNGVFLFCVTINYFIDFSSQPIIVIGSEISTIGRYWKLINVSSCLRAHKTIQQIVQLYIWFWCSRQYSVHWCSSIQRVGFEFLFQTLCCSINIGYQSISVLNKEQLNKASLQK